MSPVSSFRGGPDLSRRRSQRVILALQVIVRTDGGPKDSSFEEETHTLIVNLHGALILLSAKVTKGQMLQLKNRATHEELPCRVASVGTNSGGKTQIGVEFLTPSPDFWRITFPPEDWITPEPLSVPSESE